MREKTTQAWLNQYLPEMRRQFGEKAREFEKNRDPENKGQNFIIMCPFDQKDPVSQIAVIAMLDELHDRIVDLEARCQRAEDALAAYVLPPDAFKDAE